MWVEPEHPNKISAPLLFWALQGQQGTGRESWAQNAGWASREFCSWCRNKKEWDLSTSEKYTAGLNRPVLFLFSRTQRSCSFAALSQSKPRWASARQEQPGEMLLLRAHKGKKKKKRQTAKTRGKFSGAQSRLFQFHLLDSARGIPASSTGRF